MQRRDDHPSLVPLFDAVAEAPEDDGPRRVLSDAVSSSPCSCSRRFEGEFWLAQRAQALRNLAPHFAPFPFRRFEVRVGNHPATKEQLARLGETFLLYAT